MKVIVKTLSGRTLRLDVDLYDSVHRVKALIAEKENVAPEQQRLVFAGMSVCIKINYDCMCINM